MAVMETHDLPKIDVRRHRVAKPVARRRSGLNAAAWVGALALAVAGSAVMLLGIGVAQKSAAKRFQNQMIADAFQQYEIVKKGDDLMAKSIHAAVVADAFLMAKDSDNYHNWKKVSDHWDALCKQQIEAETKAQIERFSR